jgi:hypothetical protein
VVEELHNGAKIILAWFHNWNEGNRPFSQDWESPEQLARSELNSEQCAFMKATVEDIKENSMSSVSLVRKTEHISFRFPFQEDTGRSYV